MSLHVNSFFKGIQFDCKLCDYKGNTKSNLTDHVKSIHESIKFDCKQCDYKATSKSNLVQHVKSQKANPAKGLNLQLYELILSTH